MPYAPVAVRLGPLTRSGQLTKQQKNLALEMAELRRLLELAKTENNRDEEQRIVGYAQLTFGRMNGVGWPV